MLENFLTYVEETLCYEDVVLSTNGENENYKGLLTIRTRQLNLELVREIVETV